MSSTVISVKIDQKTKDEAQQVADQLGFSLSAVIKAQLKHLIRTRSLAVSLPEEPSDYLVKSLRQSDEDIAAGRTLSFKTGQDALAYIDSLIDHDKRND
jgi:DNA-damage-inducible protein J